MRRSCAMPSHRYYARLSRRPIYILCDSVGRCACLFRALSASTHSHTMPPRKIFARRADISGIARCLPLSQQSIAASTLRHFIELRAMLLPLWRLLLRQARRRVNASLICRRALQDIDIPRRYYYLLPVEADITGRLRCQLALSPDDDVAMLVLIIATSVL